MKAVVSVVEQFGFWHAHLQIGMQGFTMLPGYGAGDPSPKKSAEWVADMLAKGLKNVDEVEVEEEQHGKTTSEKQDATR